MLKISVFYFMWNPEICPKMIWSFYFVVCTCLSSQIKEITVCVFTDAAGSRTSENQSGPTVKNRFLDLLDYDFHIFHLILFLFATLRLNRKSIGAPVPAPAPKQTSILHTGDRKRPPKAYGIPEGLPDFPDSHSFIRTPTHKQPQADYESVREKAASQKR